MSCKGQAIVTLVRELKFNQIGIIIIFYYLFSIKLYSEYEVLEAASFDFINIQFIDSLYPS